MALFTTKRIQDSLPALGTDGAAGSPRINNRAELVVADSYMQWVMDGVVFNASHAVQETLVDLSETGRGSNNVNPALLLDVPTGTTVIPLEILVEQGLDGTDEDIQFTINTDDGTRLSSGGTTITPINMRKDDPNSSNVTFRDGGSTITASGNTDDDTIWFQWITAEALPKTAASGRPQVFWTSRLYSPPVLVGPASLLVFIVSATADQTYFYSVKWAEFTTAQVT